MVRRKIHLLICFSEALGENSSDKVSIDNFVFSQKICKNRFLYVRSVNFTPLSENLSQCDCTSCSFI